MTDNPFVPGARVAVYDRYGDGVREAFVEKVYKNGNFILCGSSQQWRPWRSSYGDQRWSATETKSGYNRSRLDLWNKTTDAEITARLVAVQLKARWRCIRVGIDDVKEPTTELCDTIKAALVEHGKRSAAL